MTVIAFFEDIGVAVSDVLVSADEIGGGIWIPSVGDPQFISPPLPVRPTRLLRKFFRIRRPRSEGIFLTCGTVSHIDSLIEMIESLTTGSVHAPPYWVTRLNVDSVASLVEVAAALVEQAGNDKFELLGMVDGKRYARHFNGPTLVHQLPYWGEVVAMGSGASYLIEWLRTKGQNFLDSGLDHEDLPLRAIRALNGIPSLLLEEDTRQMRTLREGVGGYYESFAISSSSLLSTEKVLTVFARFKRGLGGPSLEIRRIYFHIYDNDVLVVGSLTGVPLDISIAAPLQVPLNSFVVREIPSLNHVATNSTWSPSRLAMQLNSAEAFRFTSYRGQNDESIKRFYEGQDGRRLLSTKVVGNSLKLQLNESDLEHFFSRTDSSVGL